MADMYRFASEEEMSDTKAYLWSQRNYQLEQVSAKQLVTLYYFMHWDWSPQWSLGEVRQLVTSYYFNHFCLVTW